MHKLNGKTRIIGIIGHPVGHSLSPLMQNAALENCNLDFVYVPFDVHPDSLEDAVKGLRALGVLGFNVTIPHKTAIIPYLDELDETAEAAGAVNTVKNNEGRLVGYNTDGDGLVRSLAEDLDFVPGKRTILVAGAGGAARGAVAALCRAGAGQIIIFNRTASKAVELAETLGDRYGNTEILVAKNETEVNKYAQLASLLVNTTAAGMKQEVLPFIRLADLPIDAKVYDMVYSPAVTPLLSQASGLGIRGVNGLGMLAGQGELAFKIWTGILPPPGLMKSTLANICAS